MYNSVWDSLQYRGTPLLVGFTYLDWADDPDDRNSNAGYVFSLGAGPVTWLVRNNKLLLFLQQKKNIEPQLMLVRKLYGFDRSFQSLDSSSSSLLHFGATIKVPSSFPKIQFYINAVNTLSYTCTSSEILFMIVFLKCSIALQMINL